MGHHVYNLFSNDSEIIISVGRENFLGKNIHEAVVPFIPKLILKQILIILNFLVYTGLLLLFH